MIFRLAWVFSLALALAMMSRDLIQSMGDSSFVDRYDGRLLLACWEHWFRVFSGLTYWNSPGFYYPAPNVLGYTDTFLLNGVFYSSLRFCGLEPLPSMSTVILLYAVVGYSGFFSLLRRFGVNRWISVAACFLFVTGAPIQTAIGTSHIQLLSIWWLPWILHAAIAGIDAINNNKKPRAIVNWMFALGTYSLIALSTFYVAWFFAFICLVGTCTWILLNRNQVSAICTWVWTHKNALLIASIIVLPLVALFLKIYLPAYEMSGGRSYFSALKRLPEIHSLGSMSRYNRFWYGWIQLPLIYPSEAVQHELYYGFPWGFLLVFLSLAVFCWRQRADSQWALVFWAVCTVIIGWLCMLKIGIISPWYLIMKVIPGADSIRAVFRINMLYYALSLFAIALAATQLLRSPSRSMRRATITIACFLVPFLWVENYMWPRESRLRPSDETHAQASLVPPPFDADAFFAYRNLPANSHQISRDKHSAETHVMAIRASQMIECPTLNGYSGFSPHNWDIHFLAINDEWQGPLSKWIVHSNTTGPIAILNLDTFRWHPEPFSPPVSISPTTPESAP